MNARYRMPMFLFGAVILFVASATAWSQPAPNGAAPNPAPNAAANAVAPGPGGAPPLAVEPVEGGGGPAPVGPFGISVKRPVIGGACPGCPWGALADKVKEAMAPLGYNVAVCYNCSTLVAAAIVDERRKPATITQRQIDLGSTTPPDSPVDFGVFNSDMLWESYNGTGHFAGQPPRTKLRLLANIEGISYFLVAVRKESLIKDLSEIKEKHLPATILTDGNPEAQKVLDYYGITRADLESWGGKIAGGGSAERNNYTVILSFANSLNNTPESGVWYGVSQTTNLKFLQLPDALLQQLTNEVWQPRNTPINLVRGMTKPIRTIVSSGASVYGRDDMPAQFAYDVAKALDQNKTVLKWSIIPFSYEPERVWKNGNVPLHPGAARYYRERGYMK